MLRHLSSLQKVSVFTSLVFVLVITIVMLPVEHNSAVFMYVPLAAALIAMLLTGEGFTKAGWKELGLHRFSINLWAMAFFIPMMPILIGYGIVWFTGLGTFEIDPEYAGREVELFVGFFVTFVISSLTVTLGEEAGWRGYLAAKLKSLGLVRALLLNGFIWSLFHLPIMLLSDIYHADQYMPVYVPLFVVTVTLAGAFMTYLRYKTGSVWPAVIAHTAHNAAWSYGELFTHNAQAPAAYITGDAGVVLIVFYLVAFILIVKKHQRQPLL